MNQRRESSNNEVSASVTSTFGSKRIMDENRRSNSLATTSTTSRFDAKTIVRTSTATNPVDRLSVKTDKVTKPTSTKASSIFTERSISQRHSVSQVQTSFIISEMSQRKSISTYNVPSSHAQRKSTAASTAAPSKVSSSQIPHSRTSSPLSTPVPDKSFNTSRHHSSPTLSAISTRDQKAELDAMEQKLHELQNHHNSFVRETEDNFKKMRDSYERVISDIKAQHLTQQQALTSELVVLRRVVRDYESRLKTIDPETTFSECVPPFSVDVHQVQQSSRYISSMMEDLRIQSIQQKQESLILLDDATKMQSDM